MNTKVLLVILMKKVGVKARRPLKFQKCQVLNFNPLTELHEIKWSVSGSSTSRHNFPKKAGTVLPNSVTECILMALIQSQFLIYAVFTTSIYITFAIRDNWKIRNICISALLPTRERHMFRKSRTDHGCTGICVICVLFKM